MNTYLLIGKPIPDPAVPLSLAPEIGPSPKEVKLNANYQARGFQRVVFPATRFDDRSLSRV